MDKPVVGRVVRKHTSTGYMDLGRVVLVMLKEKAFWYVPFPLSRSNNTRAKACDYPKPRRLPEALITSEFSFPEFEQPKVWSLTDNELESGVVKSDLVSPRTNLKAWARVKAEKIGWLKPIVENLGAYELLECGRLNDEVNSRSKALGMTSSRKLKNALYAHLLGCGNPNVHLPNRYRSGGPGQRKLSSVKTGRRRDLVAMELTSEQGFISTEDARNKMLAGYRKYKKRHVSDRDAYLLTCREYWPGIETANTSSGENLLLAPKHKRPTLRMFTREASLAKLNATSIHMHERVRENCIRARRGTAKDGVLSVGQLGLIDSTSEDQTPVSELSPLLILPSTWRTIICDVRTEYILGLHSGFESPSTLTSLLAILHGASDKKEFCAHYGVEISDGEWHSRLPKRIRGDNGELKSEAGVKSLNSAETSIEFVRSYGARFKGEVEVKHRQLHAHADHKNLGTTRGKVRERGERSRDHEACRTHRSNMEFVIRAILRHNNEEPVPKLLTAEMRAANVPPTRRAIYEWLIQQGYEASEPVNIDELRIRCLPRLRASIHKEGLFVFDPRDPNKRHIRGLCYTSKWLQESGLCERAALRGVHKDLEVLIDPNDISQCYFIRHGALHRLIWLTRDPLAIKMTLCEYLLMMDGDKQVLEVLSSALEDGDTKRLVDNRRTNALAMKKKKEAQKAVDQAGAKSTTSGKRENREQEQRRHDLERLGIAELVAGATPMNVPANDPVHGHIESESIGKWAPEAPPSLMDQLRARRANN